MKEFRKSIKCVLVILLAFAFYTTANAQGCTITPGATEACKGTSLTFTIPNATYVNILWKFGDGQSSNIQKEVTHIYTQRGNYWVSVTTWNLDGTLQCQDSINIKIFDTPDADMILPKSNILTQCFKGNNFCFTDNSTLGGDLSLMSKWYWDFGDGDWSENQNPCKTYIQDGKFSIWLAVTDANGCSDTISENGKIVVLPNLAPRFRTIYAKTCPETPVRFLNQTDSVGKGIVSWTWDFDDGKQDNSSTIWDTFTHIYHNDGAFSPTLTIESKFGCSESFTNIAGARNIFYEFKITPTPDKPICFENNNVCYTMTPRPNAFYFLWKFDDPNSSPLNTNDESWSPCHRYSSPDIYNVSLSIWEPSCFRDTTICGIASIKGPTSTINLTTPNSYIEGKPIPLETFIKSAALCTNPDRDPIDYSLRTIVPLYLASVDSFYCNGDTVKTIIESEDCNGTLRVNKIRYQLRTHDPSKTVLNYSDIIDQLNSWTPPNTSSPASPVTFPNNAFFTPGGTHTPQTMHDTDLYIGNCQGPNYVRFTNNSKKYRLYYAIDNDPSSNIVKLNDVSQDICKNPSYPWASDSLQHFWDFGQGDACTSTVNNPQMNCQYSTEAAPWHLYPETGCFSASVREIDTVMQCTSKSSTLIIMEPPDAGYDQEIVDEYNKDKTHLPIGTLDWETQKKVTGIAARLDKNRGMILNGIPCVGNQYSQKWDLSETDPNCGQQTYWMLFDSATACESLCTDSIYTDLDGDGNAELNVRQYKKCGWWSKLSLSGLGFQWWYYACDELADPNCPCKTLGLILKTGDCLDTFFYHEYKYIYNLDNKFKLMTWRDYSPNPDRLESLNYTNDNIPVDKDGDGIIDYIIPKMEHLKLCPDYDIHVTPINQFQNSVTKFKFEVNRFFSPTWADPFIKLEDSVKAVRDTIYRLCQKDSFTIDIFTGDTFYTTCTLFPDPSKSCGPELYSSTMTLADFQSIGYIVKNTYEILDLTEVVNIKDASGKGIWQPGKYTVTSILESIPPDATAPNTVCGNSRTEEIYVGHWTDFWADDQIVCYEEGGDTVTFTGRIRYFQEAVPPVWSDTNQTPYWEDPIGLRGGSISPPAIPEFIEWDLDGDGIYETKRVTGSADVTFVYDKPGNYTVRMRTVDSLGCTQVLERKDFIKVVGTVADFEIKNNIDVCAPQNAEFANLSFGLNEYEYKYNHLGQVIDSVRKDSIIKYNWMFGDPVSGQADNSVLQSPQHTYKRNGKFTVSLIVENSNGCVDTVVKNDLIYIQGPQPLFDLVGADVHCLDSATFYFKDYSIGVSNWDFNKGDNTTHTGPPSASDSIFDITYTKPGTYFIYLTGSDSVWSPYKNEWVTCSAVASEGNDTTKFKITVLPMNPTGFSGDTLICSENEATFLDISDQAFDSITWSFGDGTDLEITNQGKSITHKYKLPAGIVDTIYNVSINPSGAPCPLNPDIQRIRVVKVISEFEVHSSTIMPNFYFENKTEGATNYDWDFGGGKPAQWETDNKNMAHTNYGNVQDSFEVCLTAKILTAGIDDGGCQQTVCKWVKNEFNIGLLVPNVFTPGVEDGKNDVFQLRRSMYDTREAIGIEKFELIIYNRWGEKVFETTKLEVSQEEKGSMTVGEFWNGVKMNDGTPCPAGTYFWTVNFQLRGEQMKNQSGTVTLVR